MRFEESEHLIVPSKSGNPTQGDPAEGRGCQDQNPLEGKMTDIPRSETISTKRQRIAEQAKNQPELAFTSISHHIDLEWMYQAWEMTRKDGAVGVDGVDAEEYAVDLEGNLTRLLEAFKAGTYRAPPVRRVLIPKGDGKKARPIGVPTFEDKILQRAVVMLLECIYEQDFVDLSHGFRPGRSAHGALEQFRSSATAMRGGWVIDADIQKFFDTLDHTQLRRFLDLRVLDGVLRRAIDKWLKAGALEGDRLLRSQTGSPQGGVISPLLANLYLHYALDTWFESEVRPRMRGAVDLVRYADDFLIIAQRRDDMERIMKALPKRLNRFGLNLHSTKTRCIPFQQPPFRWRREKAATMPEVVDPSTFDFLGFTHYWGGTRSGGWALKRKTARDRFSRFVRNLNVWCKVNRCIPLRDQHRIISSKLRGFGAYYGLSGNGRALESVRFRAQEIWRKWLRRRSQRGHMPWNRFNAILRQYPLPRLRVVHH